MKKALLSLLLLLTLGCATSRHAQVSLLLQPQPSPPPCKRRAVLTLAPLTADAPYSTPLMAYSLAPLEVEFYAYHQWAAPLPKLVTQALRESFYRWECFTLAPYAPDHFLLKGRILRFFHRFQGEESWGEVAIRFSLTYRDKVLAQKTFQARATAPQNTPKGGAEALNQALEMAISELMAWLEKETKSIEAE